MTPEMERALRLSPRIRKNLRKRQAALSAAVEETATPMKYSKPR